MPLCLDRSRYFITSSPLHQVLATLLAAVIGAAADEKLHDVAGPFARGICRHFAMLFAAGAHPPPPAPMMARQSQVRDLWCTCR